MDFFWIHDFVSDKRFFLRGFILCMACAALGFGKFLLAEVYWKFSEDDRRLSNAYEDFQRSPKDFLQARAISNLS